MAVKFQKQYTNLNEQLYDVAKNHKYFDEESFEDSVAKNEDTEYLESVLGTDSLNSNTFDENVYSKLQGRDKYDYLLTEYYMDKGSDYYKQNHEFFQTKYQQALDQEFYDNLNGLEKTIGTIGGVVGNVLNEAILGTAEGIKDIVGGTIALGGEALSMIWDKDFNEQNVLNVITDEKYSIYSYTSKALQKFERRYTAIDKNKVVKVANDVAVGIGRMIPMLINPLQATTVAGVGLGTLIYYGGMAGNNLEYGALNSDYGLLGAYGYATVSTALEAGIEKASGLIGGSGIDRLMSNSGKTIFKNAFASMGTDFLSEGVEEMASEIANSVLNYVLISPENGLNVNMQDVLYAGLVGGLTGSIMTGGQIATTSKIGVESDGRMINISDYKKSLSKEQIKDLKKDFGSVDTGIQKTLNLSQIFNKSESYHLKTNLASALDTLAKSNVSDLARKKGVSENELKEKFSKEYEEALEKDEKIMDSYAETIVGLNKVLQLTGEEGFKKASNLVNKTYEEQRRLLQQYTNKLTGTTAENRAVELKFKNKIKGSSLSITDNLTADQIKIKNYFKGLGYNLYFGKIGEQNGIIKNYGITLDEKTIVIDDTLHKDMSVEQMLDTKVKHELSHTLQYVDDVVNETTLRQVNEAGYALGIDFKSKSKDIQLDPAYNKDSESVKNREIQAEILASNLLFDDITVDKIFGTNNDLFVKVYRWCKDKINRSKFSNDKDKVTFRNLQEVVKRYRKIATMNIGNQEDLNKIADMIELTNEQKKEIENSLKPNYNTSHYVLTKFNRSSKKRLEANNFLLNSRIDNSPDNPFDFNRVYDPSYYKDVTLDNGDSISFEEFITTEYDEPDFQHALQDYMIDNFNMVIHSESNCLLEIVNYNTKVKKEVKDLLYKNVKNIEDLQNIKTVSDLFTTSFNNNFTDENGYNSLNDVKIIWNFVDNDERLNARYETSSELNDNKPLITVTINKNIDYSSDTQKGLNIYHKLLHEVTHHLAKVQGLPEGTSPNTIYKNIYNLDINSPYIKKLCDVILTEETYEQYKNDKLQLYSHLAYGMYLISDGEMLAESYKGSNSKITSLDDEIKTGYFKNKTGLRNYPNGTLIGYGRLKGVIITPTRMIESDASNITPTNFDRKSLQDVSDIVSYNKSNELVAYLLTNIGKDIKSKSIQLSDLVNYGFSEDFIETMATDTTGGLNTIYTLLNDDKIGNEKAFNLTLEFLKKNKNISLENVKNYQDIKEIEKVFPIVVALQNMSYVEYVDKKTGETKDKDDFIEDKNNSIQRIVHKYEGELPSIENIKNHLNTFTEYFFNAKGQEEYRFKFLENFNYNIEKIIEKMNDSNFTKAVLKIDTNINDKNSIIKTYKYMKSDLTSLYKDISINTIIGKDKLTLEDTLEDSSSNVEDIEIDKETKSDYENKEKRNEILTNRINTLKKAESYIKNYEENSENYKKGISLLKINLGIRDSESIENITKDIKNNNQDSKFYQALRNLEKMTKQELSVIEKALDVIEHENKSTPAETKKKSHFTYIKSLKNGIKNARDSNNKKEMVRLSNLYFKEIDRVSSNSFKNDFIAQSNEQTYLDFISKVDDNRKDLIFKIRNLTSIYDEDFKNIVKNDENVIELLKKADKVIENSSSEVSESEHPALTTYNTVIKKLETTTKNILIEKINSLKEQLNSYTESFNTTEKRNFNINPESYVELKRLKNYYNRLQSYVDKYINNNFKNEQIENEIEKPTKTLVEEVKTESQELNNIEQNTNTSEVKKVEIKPEIKEETKVEKVKEPVVNNNNRIKEIDDNIKEITSKIELLNKDLSILKETFEEGKKTLEKSSESEKKSIQSQLDLVEKNIIKNETSIREYEKELKKLNKELKSLQPKENVGKPKENVKETEKPKELIKEIEKIEKPKENVIKTEKVEKPKTEVKKPIKKEIPEKPKSVVKQIKETSKKYEINLNEINNDLSVEITPENKNSVIVDGFLKLGNDAVQITNEVQGVDTDVEHNVISLNNISTEDSIKLSTLASSIDTKEEFDKIIKDFKNSPSKYANQALMLFEFYIQANINIIRNKSSETATHIERYISKTQSEAGQRHYLQSVRVADLEPISQTIQEFNENGRKVVVTFDMLLEFDNSLKDSNGKLKDKETLIKELESKIEKLTKENEDYSNKLKEQLENEQEIDDLKNQLKNLSKDNNEQLKDLKSKIETLEKANEKLKKEIKPIENTNRQDELKKAIAKRDCVKNNNAAGYADTIVAGTDSLQKASEILDKIVVGGIKNSTLVEDDVDSKDDKKKPKLSKIEPFEDTKKKVAKVIQKLNSYRITAMLSNPMTYVRNYMNNLGMSTLDKLTDIVVKNIDIRAKDYTENEWSYKPENYNKTDGEFLAEKYNGLITDYIRGSGNLKYEYNESDSKKKARSKQFTKAVLEQEIAEAKDGFTKCFKRVQLLELQGLEYGWTGDENFIKKTFTKNLVTIINSNKNKVMSAIRVSYKQAIDDPNTTEFRKSLYEKALKTQSFEDMFNLLDNSKNDKILISEFTNILQIAYNMTTKQYFKNENNVSKWINDMKKAHPSMSLLFDIVLPFPKVAVNVLTSAYRYSPFGFITALNKKNVLEQAEKLGFRTSNGKIVTGFERMEMRRSFAEASVGTIAWVAGALFAALGMIDIEDDDYLGPALNLGVTRIGLSNLAPALTTFSMGAALIYAIKNDPNKIITEQLGVLYDSTLLGNVDNIFRYGSLENYAGNGILSYFGQYIPAFSKWIAKYFDPAVKDKTGNLFEKFLKQTASAVPFLSHAVPNKIDPYTGKSQKIYNSDNLLLHFIGNTMPLGIEFKNSFSKNYTNLEIEAVRLSAETTGVSGRFTINGKEFSIKDFDKQNLAKFRAKYLNDQFEAIFNDKLKVTVEMNDGSMETTVYSKLNDEQKQKVIKNLYTKASDIAKVKMWLDKGNTYVENSKDKYNLYKEYLKDYKNLIYNKGWKTSKFVEK